MANFEVVFLDGEGNETYIRCLKKFHVAKAHADSVAGQVWVNFVDKSGKMDRQKIYPKEKPTINWTDIHDALCMAARIKKLSQKPMFRYEVFCGDYSLEGFVEETTYSGTNRAKALEAYRDAKEWLGVAKVNIIVLGREKQYYERLEERDWLGEVLEDWD